MFFKKVFLFKLIAVIYITYGSISFPNFFYILQNQTSSSLNSTSLTCAGPLIVTASADLISAILRTLLPFGFMLVLNILMSKKILFKSHLVFFKSKQVSKSRRERQFTMCVLAMNTVFLVLNFPEAIGYILRNALLTFQKPSFETVQIFNFYWMLAYVFATSNYIVTILSNLSFNKIFRKEFYHILKFLGNSNKYNRETSSNNITPRQINAVSISIR